MPSWTSGGSRGALRSGPVLVDIKTMHATGDRVTTLDAREPA